MGDETPKSLVDALDLVRGSSAPSIEALGVAEAKQFGRVRDIFADRNIVGVGIADKITENTNTGTLSLCFYVEKKIPKSRMKIGKMIPPVVAAPDGSACFTDVLEIGRVAPQLKRKQSPIHSGFSVAHFGSGAGTVGAVVKKGKSLFILSNAHVLALSGKAETGDLVTYPGPLDRGNKPRQDVAALADVVGFDTSGEMVNRVDAALAKIDPTWRDKIDFEIFKVKGSPEIIEPKRGMTIAKRGRTTGETTGTVQDVHFSIVIDYPGVGTIGFVDQVLCTRYSKSGDSGSIVVDQDSGKVVGLHFAGSLRGSIFNPIHAVMKALKFKFV